MLAKVPLKYLIGVELIYGVYEMLLAKNSSHDSLAMVPGLLLAALTLPSDVVLFYAASYLDSWLHFGGGDNKDFLPRFLVIQLAIAMNAALIGWYISASNAKQTPLDFDQKQKRVALNDADV